MNQPHLPVPDSTTAFVPLKIIASGVALPPGCVTSAMLDERLGMKPGYVENARVSLIAFMPITRPVRRNWAPMRWPLH